MNAARPKTIPQARTFPDDNARWRAVTRRDASADAAFVYSVRTTGVYCRPSCAARLPNRENVRFHATPEEAARAGFRPCKRCRPNDASLAERRQDAVEKACRLIESANEVPTLAALAKTVGCVPLPSRSSRSRGDAEGLRGRHRAGRAGGTTDGRDRDRGDAGAGFNSNGHFYATAGATG